MKPFFDYNYLIIAFTYKYRKACKVVFNLLSDARASFLIKVLSQSIVIRMRERGHTKFWGMEAVGPVPSL